MYAFVSTISSGIKNIGDILVTNSIPLVKKLVVNKPKTYRIKRKEKQPIEKSSFLFKAILWIFIKATKTNNNSDSDANIGERAKEKAHTYVTRGKAFLRIFCIFLLAK